MEDKKNLLVDTIFETKRDDHLADTIWYQYIPLMQKHSQYGIPKMSDNGRRLKDMEKEMMGDENMEKRKFKIGDKIRIANGSYMKSNGKIATIVNIDCSDYRPYHVQVHETKDIIYLNPEEMELVEEKEMKPFELLLNHWGIEVGEKFIIKEGNYDYYYFDSKGVLKDSTEAYAGINPWDLVTGRKTIEKFKPAKEMTVAEIEKELGYAIKVVKEEK